MENFTGKTKQITVLGREITYFNQRCRQWTHPYEYMGCGDLSHSGCGIFSLCVCIQWLTGKVQDPEYWADFSVANGGRGDDGTDRPGLLHGMMATGKAQENGFFYNEDGLRNDLDTLFNFLLHEEGVSMCNLRPGHIVALVAAREIDGMKQVLAIDSVADSVNENVKDHVRELIPGSENVFPVRNCREEITGTTKGYGAFWVDASLPRDFNLLHKIKMEG